MYGIYGIYVSDLLSRSHRNFLDIDGKVHVQIKSIKFSENWRHTAQSAHSAHSAHNAHDAQSAHSAHSACVIVGSRATKGVFLVKMKNAFVPVKRDNSVNTYLRISTVPRGSERSEWASPWTERSEAERCGASERSERCERTNVASDRVARSKRDRLWLETPP